MNRPIIDGTMAEMTGPEIEAAVRAAQAVLLPSGILEAHGPHLSIAPDIYFSCEIAREAQQRLQEAGIATVIAPPAYWGIAGSTAAFPGSFTVRASTLRSLMADILICLHRWGAKLAFIIDIHDDSTHRAAILGGIGEAAHVCGMGAAMLLSPRLAAESGLSGTEPGVLIKRDNPAATGFTTIPDIHAGALEASFIKRYYPGDYRAEQGGRLAPVRLDARQQEQWQAGWAAAKAANPAGYVGDPARLNEAMAQQYIKVEGDNVREAIQRYMKQ